LGLHARNCRTGDTLDEQQVQVVRKEDVLNALGQIASKFRTRAGESLSTVERYSTPLAEAATSSLEALKAYSMGWKVLDSSGPPAALPFFKRATEIDPKFAAAHAWLGWRYGEIGEGSLSRESIMKARQLRDRASDQERFAIDFSYDRLVTRNLAKAHQTCELWAQTYPRDLHPHSFLGAAISTALGRFENAGEEAKKTIELDPDHSFAYHNLAASYIYRDRLAEAQITLQQASERKLDMPEFLVLRYQIAFLKDDKPEMQRLAALGQESADDWMCDLESSVLAYSGRLQHARRKSRRAVTLAQEGGHHEKAAQYAAGIAVREMLFGNTSDARRSAAAALDFSNDRDAEYGAALAFAFSGDSSRSQMLADDLEKRFPEDTVVRFSYLPAVRALLALNHHEPLQAIELLQAAVSYELGKVEGSSGGESFYPIYVRGLAYLAAHQGTEAAAEFQKILDHRGIVVSEPIGALARLQAGRGFVVAGDKAKAKAAYKDFLTLWTDADPDIPIFKQAKAEYAKLQ
jgi:Flp pilus assembly protein TadD